MEEIYENDTCIIFGDTPNTTQIIASDTRAIYNSNDYDNYDEYDDNYDEYDEYDDYNELLYFKNIGLNLNLSLPNVNGDTVIMYLIKKPFDMLNDDYDRDNFIDSLIDRADSNTLSICDAHGQSLFDITLKQYLEINKKCKKNTDYLVSRKDLKIRCIEEQTRRIERVDEENEMNHIYNTNLEKRQVLLLNRLKTIYSKLSEFSQNEIDTQYYEHIMNGNSNLLNDYNILTDYNLLNDDNI